VVSKELFVKEVDMGQVISLYCAKCEYSKSFHLGIGMMYSPSTVFDGSYIDDEKPLLDSLVKSKKIKEQAFSLLNEQFATPTDDYGHEIYYCPHCNELYERFYFCILYDGGSYEPEYKCTKCKHLLHRAKVTMEDGEIQLFYTNNKIIDWQCPQCGNSKLNQGRTIGVLMWD